MSKAREAGIADSEVSHQKNESGLGAGVDTDADENWVSTLVQGAWMLCRLALQTTDYSKALDQAKEAGAMIEKAKTRLNESDRTLLASVQLAEGVWSGAMAHTGPLACTSNHFVLLIPEILRARSSNSNEQTFACRHMPSGIR